ncbi:MAG: phosphate signaling complex protein PhoU [Gammaproteobacteria bacterium]|nr:phosphate signaling complex protein PhoU [Gammaproteobacteria bacterium]
MLAPFIKKEESLIRKNILLMGNNTREAIISAMKSYNDQNHLLADKVINNDIVINKQKAEIESECIKVIATQQPVANDLREFLADMNIAMELERIADYAVAIAKIVQKMPAGNEQQEPDIILMAEKCVYMLDEVLVDYAEQDAEKASRLALKDDEIDLLEHNLNDKFIKLMQSESENSVHYTYQLWIIRQLERIGDRVTNIAESVIFLATGKLVNLN